MGDAQATIGGDHDGSSDDDTTENGDDHDAILNELPPKRLLDTNDPKLLRGGVRCMRSVETVRQYVAYENSNAQRQHVLERLQARAAELRSGD